MWLASHHRFDDGRILPIYMHLKQKLKSGSSIHLVLERMILMKEINRSWSMESRFDHSLKSVFYCLSHWSINWWNYLTFVGIFSALYCVIPFVRENIHSHTHIYTLIHTYSHIKYTYIYIPKYLYMKHNLVQLMHFVVI